MLRGSERSDERRTLLAQLIRQALKTLELASDAYDAYERRGANCVRTNRCRSSSTRADQSDGRSVSDAAVQQRQKSDELRVPLLAVTPMYLKQLGADSQHMPSGYGAALPVDSPFT
jgi:hypothetical protein